jgi:hypothetical protein
MTVDALYGGYEPSTNDLVIDGYRLICTSIACPEQYEVFDNESEQQVGYLRLRHGHFRADYPYCGGDTVYEDDTRGDGIFDDDERMPQLTNAIAALKKARLADLEGRVSE